MTSKLMLKKGRLSFPALFTPAEYTRDDGTKTHKYEATILLDKDADSDQIDAINAMIDRFLDEKFGAGKVPKSVKRSCLIDGDTKDYGGYENKIAVKGGSQKRLTLIDRDRTPLVESDNKLYAGVWVNAIVSPWYSDHPKGGKQVLLNITGIQFVDHGEAFGADTAASVDEFEELDDDLL